MTYALACQISPHLYMFKVPALAFSATDRSDVKHQTIISFYNFTITVIIALHALNKSLSKPRAGTIILII